MKILTFLSLAVIWLILSKDNLIDNASTTKQSDPFSDVESVEMFGSTITGGGYPPSWSRAEYAVFDLSSGEKTRIRLMQREISSYRISYPFIPRSLFLEGHQEHVERQLGADELSNPVFYEPSPTLSKALLKAQNKKPGGLTHRERMEIPTVYSIYLYDRNTTKLTIIESGLNPRLTRLGGFSASERTAIYYHGYQTRLFDLETHQLKAVKFPGRPVKISNGICFLIFDQKTHTYVSIDESGKKLYELKSDKIQKPFEGYALNEHLFIVTGSIRTLLSHSIPDRVYLLDLATGYVRELGIPPPSGRVVKVNYKK